ncbi:MAG: S46 family peptidase, partial [Candidatus Aminicenantaceae bacterium]
MKKVMVCVLFFSLVLIFPAMAEEGMWLLTQLKQLELEKKGLEISVEDIYHPEKTSLTDAIVWLGGCTASFVSPEGLLLTNHHCAEGALQRASSEGNDYIKNGFLAKDRSEELQAIGTRASVLEKITDVTKEILAASEGIQDPVERDKKINGTITQMTEKIEDGRDDILANVAAMYNGKQYILFVYKRYQDVRVVYAPPDSIGTYGGDIDNWMWPRHTGDFTYLRVYMAPDGSGAKYSPDNIPVKPKNYLRVAKDHLKDGDFTFILGFPGATTRWRTSNSVGWNLKYNYPETIQNFKELIDLMATHTKDSEEGRIRVASLDSGLNNTMKNSQGKIDGMIKTNFLERKKNFEKDLMSFIESKPDLKEKYGDILDLIKAQYTELAKLKAKDDAMGLFGFSNGVLSSLASQIYGTAREREKPDEERAPYFTERSVEQTVKNLHLRYFSYYEPVDKAMLKRVLGIVKDLPDGQRIEGLEYLFSGSQSIDDFVEEAYTKTELMDVEYARSLFDKSSKELEALGDPLINMAAKMYDETEALQKRTEKFNANIISLRKEYIDALYEWKGEGLYPDANGTMRFTYGHVAGYRPADAVWYEPFTTLKGVVEKDTGEFPFDNPDKLNDLWEKKDFGQWADSRLDDVPVAFTHRCDITGG